MKMFMTHDPEVGFEIIKQLLSNQVMSRFICFQRNYRLSFSMTFIITHTHIPALGDLSLDSMTL